ncbi:hypothetical protein [Trinickia mobilis]|uniref:hypothetical protein n=1 Tax=Trinickia mobilis TaxID=2816356 RepID=UPI001A8D3938|nr:hypothetical protein [Trinickia mobilis]
MKRPDTDGRRWTFKDPAEVYERREVLTCAGCRHNRPTLVGIGCRMDMRNGVEKIEDSERCALYEEKA